MDRISEFIVGRSILENADASTVRPNMKRIRESCQASLPETWLWSVRQTRNRSAAEFFRLAATIILESIHFAKNRPLSDSSLSSAVASEIETRLWPPYSIFPPLLALNFTVLSFLAIPRDFLRSHASTLEGYAGVRF